MSRKKETFENADFFYNQGHEMLDKCEYDLAIDNFSKAIELKPDYMKAYFNRARLWADKNEIDKAIEDYTRVTEIQPSLAKAYNNRSNLWLTKGNFENALIDLDRSIELDSNISAPYINRGVLHHSVKEYDKAIDDFSKALILSPENYSVYYYLGCSLCENGDLDNAFETISKVILLKPDYAEAYNVRAMVRYEKKEYAKSMEDCDKAISLNPALFDAYRTRGLTLHYMGKYQEAIEDFSKAILLDPNHANVYYNRGNSWYFLNEYDRAIQDFSKSIELEGNFFDVFNCRGDAWESKKYHDKAIEDFTQAISLDQGNVISYNNRGNSWKSLKEYNKALTDYKQAIELKPDFAAPYFNLYSLHLEFNKNLSQAYLNRANYLHLDWTFPIIEAYHKQFFLPFMLRRLLRKLFNKQNQTFFLNIYSENQKYCENWELYLDLINYEFPTNKIPFEILRLKALVTYFMGDCIEAFKIYDGDIDGNETCSINLRDQYYYIRSAQEFLEPYENILQFALQQAKEDANRSAEDKYYAGKLYLLDGKIKIAESFFISSGNDGFRPSLYQLVGLYHSILPDLEKRDEICFRIKRLEEMNADRYSLINGIKPLIISEKLDLYNKLYDACKYYAYYDENIEEIQIVRDLLGINNPYSESEFWNFIELRKENKIFFDEKIEHYELQEFEDSLFKSFDEYCKTEKEEGFLKRISDNNQALNVYKNLKNSIDDEDFKKSNLTYEKALAQKITDMKNEKIEPKWFLVFTKLLYLKNHISIKEAITLHLYAKQIALNNGDQSLIEGINLELEVWATYITKIPSSFIIKLIFKSFKFIRDGFTFQNPPENDFIGYVEFKERYYDYLDFYKNSLINEFHIEN